MHNKPRCSAKPSGIIEVTDDGYPIVTGEYACYYWQAGTMGLCTMRECWYCKFADFRKKTETTLETSICRCPQNRMGVVQGSKNEHFGEDKTNEYNSQAL